MQGFGFKRVGLISVALLSLFAAPAHANVGLPMIAVMWPLMMLALLPIIAIETYVICTRLALSVGYAATVTFVANAVSTIIGIPVAWFLLLLTPVVRAAWISPFEEKKESDPDSFVANSALVLLVPFFFASWFIEYRIAIRMVPWLERGTVNAAVLAGNLITYGCLAAFILGVSIWAIRREQRAPIESSSANIGAATQDYDDGLAPVLDESSV